MGRVPLAVTASVGFAGAVTVIEPQVAIDHGHALHIDHFALVIGATSVGLPRAGTTDDVFRRYLDLLRLVRRDREGVMDSPASDLLVLASATATASSYVARRLVALQND